MRKTKFAFPAVLLMAAWLTACTSYERQVVPFKMPAAYPNATAVADATIAAKAYDNKEEAAAAFGFDIRGTGILPVQVIFDNAGGHSLEILTDKTFLVDEEANLWPILDQRMAYDRLSGATELGKVMPEAAKGGFLGGAAGAVIGAAIGIVTGQNVAAAAGKGAALGAAAGITMGGPGGWGNRMSGIRSRRISATAPSKSGPSPRTRWPMVSSSTRGRPRSRRSFGSASRRSIRRRSIR